MAEALRLYAGTQEGMVILRGVGDIWTSMRGSREYQSFFPDQVVDSVWGCRNNPEVVYAGVTQDGLYRTRDQGRHWQRVLEGDIRWVTVDPIEDRVVYAGTEPVMLFRSEDGGGSWEELEGLRALPPEVQHHWWFPYPPHHGHVRHIYIDPDNTGHCLSRAGARRHRAQLRPWRDLGGRERGHRVPGRSHDRPFAREPRRLLHRHLSRVLSRRPARGRVAARRAGHGRAITSTTW